MSVTWEKKMYILNLMLKTGDTNNILERLGEQTVKL